MNFKGCLFPAWLFSSATVLALGLAPGRAGAQTTPVPAPATGTAPKNKLIDQVIDNQVYTYVEQLPQLPGGGGARAVAEAIQSQIHYPPAALRQHLEGRVLVGFVVGDDGVVRDCTILHGIGGGCDEEALAAVRSLPRFIPGKQQGKPVAVSFTVPVNFRIPDFPVALPDTLKQVYALVNQMPHLPNTEGSAAIFQTIQRVLVMPAEVANDTLRRKVFVGFTVGPSGVIRDIKVVRGLNTACNAAALAAVQKLPRLVGGKLNGAPASVRLTVPVLFGRLSKE